MWQILNRLFSTIDDVFDHVKKPFYLITIIIIYGSYLLFLFGIYNVNPSYITSVFKYFEIFLCLFFIIRFHPFRKAVLRDFDQYLIFVSGFIILTNVGIIEYIVNIVNKNKTLSDIVHVLHRGTPSNSSGSEATSGVRLGPVGDQLM